MGAKRHERTRARRAAIQVLYLGEIRKLSPLTIAESDDSHLIEDGPIPVYALELVRGVCEHRNEVDEHLAAASENWSLGHIAKRLDGAARPKGCRCLRSLRYFSRAKRMLCAKGMTWLFWRLGAWRRALGAAELLEAQGIDARVVDTRWVKPLDAEEMSRVLLRRFESAGSRNKFWGR